MARGKIRKATKVSIHSRVVIQSFKSKVWFNFMVFFDQVYLSVGVQIAGLVTARTRPTHYKFRPERVVGSGLGKLCSVFSFYVS